MSKKYFLLILVSHAIVPISLLFPVLQISQGLEHINIFEYISQNQYFYVKISLVTFIIAELCGLANAIYGLSKKDLHHKNIQMSFLLGFSSAILGAMLIGAGSYMFSFICAISFVVISYSAIKLMKKEN